MKEAGDWSPKLQKSRVYEQMLLDIVLGDLAPDRRLDERELARRYDSGLAGVREALGRLALEGLVVRRARVGTTVASLDPAEARQADEARLLIEPHCAALAADRATPAEIARITEVFDAAEAAVEAGDRRGLVSMDQAFHAAVAAAGHNGVLAKVSAGLQLKSARFWVRTGANATRDENAHAIARHREVIERISARDPDGAGRAMAATLVD